MLWFRALISNCTAPRCSIVTSIIASDKPLRG
jgi:hypothetical protein